MSAPPGVNFATTDNFPAPYISLIMRALDIGPGDSVLELGCGTGELAVALADRGVLVQAVDRSATMIERAMETHHHAQGVTWTCADAHAVASDSCSYDSVIAFESFHLFPDPHDLTCRLKDRLTGPASLGIGWRMAGWESLLSNVITGIFESYGVPFRDWGYWLCPELPRWLDGEWEDPRTISISVPTTTSLHQAVQFLSRIERAWSIPPEGRDQFIQDLRKALSARLGGEAAFVGTTRFGITVTAVRPRA